MRLSTLAASVAGLGLLMAAPMVLAQQPAQTPAPHQPAGPAPVQPAAPAPAQAAPGTAPATPALGQPAAAPGAAPAAAETPPPAAEPAKPAGPPASVEEIEKLEHMGSEHHLKTPVGDWTFEGFNGYFDQNQLQRGYKVYREVCSTCHSMKLMSFRNLGMKGGPFYDAKYPNPSDNPVVKQLAVELQIPGINPDSGDEEQVNAKPADRFPNPYKNAIAARATNGGALPPDLSVIVKARHGGASYIYSLLTGFVEPPSGLTVNSGQHYNIFFPGDTGSQWAGDPRHKPPGGFLAMNPPLRKDGLVTYDDGTNPTIDQMAQDVAAFLAWSSEPKQQTRHEMGIAAIAYLAILALLVYLSYRRIWRNVEH